MLPFPAAGDIPRKTCCCDTTRRQYTPDYPVGPSVKIW
ncbi:hypothetical protein PspLS_07435 [Pyricularia sp. CBS 133598]|nr:hypothetical protein PspLS_07435 [Pyricularia sp. CBS 133598]